MNNDYLDPINAENMPQLADTAFATDLLLSVKNGVRNLAFALGETTTPELRATLRAQLAKELDMHDDVTALLLRKGWLHAFDVNEQLQLDLVSADTIAKIARLPLFPGDTSRDGMFATPNI